jgi:toxin ParE1/3/4
MKTIITDPDAQAELEKAAEWYEQRREGLGAEFLDGIAEAIVTIQRMPKVFPLFQNTTIRKYVMHRFPYLIFYEELPNQIWIYAFAHSKRKPGYWLSRTDKEEPLDE